MGGNSATRNHSSPREDALSNRSFIARFFTRPSNRHVNDFHIRPVDPHRKYAAGDHVTGAVLLTVLRPIRITHLTVTLHGFVKVYKNPSSAHEQPVNPALAPSGTTGRTRYFGNGLASLFQDEQVLSGDVRLEPGRYEYNFDLLFPSKVALPPSIDFERGTISYLITATLTRPTTISPTTSCDRKIEFRDNVDIGSIPVPRPRTISLEPISRRPRRKRPDRPIGTDRGSSPFDGPDHISSDIESSRGPESVADDSTTADDAAHETHRIPRSPGRVDIPDVVSEVSAESHLTTSTGGGYRGSDVTTSSSSASQLGARARTPTAEDKTITASVEMLKGGCLPGDFIPVKISVRHIKRIKSVHGVIATLYRQGRIDSAPPISLFTDLSKEDIRRLEKEEYFPRSKTGLSGLSLSSAGSCSVFRKDLSQAFGPLIIDPVTLDASVTISVRMPEDAFPTIKGVPGELISFKYQLEVIVDLGGKLASQISSGQSKPGGMAGGGAAMPSIRNPYESSSTILGHWGGSMVDTDQLRRHKGVISVLFDVPVGTLDSSRQRVRGGSLRPNPLDTPSPQPTEQQPTVAVLYGPDEKPHTPDVMQNGNYANHLHNGTSHMPEFAPSPYYTPHDTHTHPTPIYIPSPDVPDEARMSEKDRIRRAEQRLLPSQPLVLPIAGPSSAAESHGTDIYNADDAPAEAGPSSAPPSQEVSTTLGEIGASAPTLDEVEADEVEAGPGRNGEDKLERERQRLLHEASAPPEFPEDYDNGAPGPSSPGPMSDSTAPAAPGDFEPSAPLLSEDDNDLGYSYFVQVPTMSRPPGMAFMSRAMTAPAEPLPRYQR